VIGADPRNATTEQGEEGLAVAAERLAAAVQRAAEHDRAAYIAALGAGIRALEALWDLRQRIPRDQVPPVQTEPWLDHCRALHEGRYDEAEEAAERKLVEMVE
jgi:hypothetical protein